MSVLSRPTRHHVKAETQREAQLPLQRTASESENTTTTTRPSQVMRPAPQPRRTRVTMIVGGGLAVALAIGVGAYALLDDDGGSSTVIAPAVTNVPDFADLGRDAAAAGRGPDAGGAAPRDAGRISDAQRDAALAQRARNLREGTGDAPVPAPAPAPAPQAPVAGAGTGSLISGADQITEAQRDAALARRAQNTPE